MSRGWSEELGIECSNVVSLDVPFVVYAGIHNTSYSELYCLPVSVCDEDCYDIS